MCDLGVQHDVLTAASASAAKLMAMTCHCRPHTPVPAQNQHPYLNPCIPELPGSLMEEARREREGFQWVWMKFCGRTSTDTLEKECVGRQAACGQPRRICFSAMQTHPEPDPPPHLADPNHQATAKFPLQISVGITQTQQHPAHFLRLTC